MEDKSSNSQILEKIQSWVLGNLIDEKTDAALLVGSWAEGRAKEKSDIDIILIRHDQPTLVTNIKKNVEGKNLDIWIHTHEYMLETLQKEVSSLSDIYQKSLFLSFIGNCVVWFEKDNYVQKNSQICKSWKWKLEDRIYINMLGKPPEANWARSAYEENLNILTRFEHNFDNNLPISHRLKDYPEMHKPVEK
ncbi:MAG: nucleotidyltransferase domain-containing protein, partial [Candidatus Heimdallarchaeota archaeon]|nr:nucleotidyltransferase domain-containing protein [Candidatus Heimdallarchaeota archaeon]